MSTRSWTRQARRTNFSPNEILIAGVDFDTPADDPLRDEPSPTREAARDELLLSLRYGFFGSLTVTARVLPGRAEPVPVVVDGRRRVLLSREVNQERQAAGLEPWTWSVEYRPDAGGLMFEVARRLNRGGVAETPAQVAHYLARMINQGASATYAAETLGIAPTRCQEDPEEGLRELAVLPCRVTESGFIVWNSYEPHPWAHSEESEP